MNISQEYKSEINYIGNSPWQYKYTDKLYRRLSGINYTAYWHDILYGELVWKEQGVIMKTLLKILLDLVFLVMGFFRCVRNVQIHGCVIVIILYLVLLINTPFYIWRLYKK